MNIPQFKKLSIKKSHHQKYEQNVIKNFTFTCVCLNSDIIQLLCSGIRTNRLDKSKNFLL
jgi:hypothetical protein